MIEWDEWIARNIASVRMRHPAEAERLARQADHGPQGTLILVRHGPVAPDPQRSAREWTLTADGEKTIVEMARDHVLANMQLVASSPEPKAVRTAELLAQGRPVIQVPDLRELDRSSLHWVDNQSAYAAIVEEILRRPNEAVHGCESATAAGMRVTAAIDDLTSTYQGQTIAVVSHGMVLSLYVAHLNNVEQSASMIWQSMGLPDLAVVDPRWRFLISGFRGQ